MPLKVISVRQLPVLELADLDAVLVHEC